MLKGNHLLFMFIFQEKIFLIKRGREGLGGVEKRERERERENLKTTFIYEGSGISNSPFFTSSPWDSQKQNMRETETGAGGS